MNLPIESLCPHVFVVSLKDQCTLDYKLRSHFREGVFVMNYAITKYYKRGSIGDS